MAETTSATAAPASPATETQSAEQTAEALVAKLKAADEAAHIAPAPAAADAHAPAEPAAAPPVLSIGTYARHLDGRIGMVASRRVDGGALAAVRLQIGRTLTDWLPAASIATE